MPEETLSTIPEEDLQPQPAKPRGIAPVWHTLLLIAAILTYSFWGTQRISANNPLAPVHQSATKANAATAKPARQEGEDHRRILRYGLSCCIELLVVAYILLGLHLRKTHFHSLLGSWPRTLNEITKEAAIATAFWLCSMLVLLIFALSWNFVQTKIYEHQTRSQPQAPSNAPKPKSPQEEQAENIQQLMQMAPANGFEITAWGALCLVVGFSEEIIFRGYFQSQGISLLASIPISIVLTSVLFGAAHGYQGLRGICLITVYGSLFSIITLLRRNLFPAMLSHAWHDFATGLALALIREGHLLDRLPKSS